MGALIGTLYYIGYKPAEILKIFIDLDVDDLKEIDFSTFLDDYGLLKSTKFEKWLKGLIHARLGYGDITFKQVYDRLDNGVKLTLTGSNLSKNRVDNFNVDTHPDMSIYTAVRISISIPFLISSVKYQGDVYIDGAVLEPFPFHYHDSNTLGFIIKSNTPDIVNSLGSYLHSLYYCYKNQISKLANNIDFNNLNGNTTLYFENRKAAIVHYVGDVPMMKFDITPEFIKDLFKIGYECSDEYVNNTLALNNIDHPYSLESTHRRNSV